MKYLQITVGLLLILVNSIASSAGLITSYGSVTALNDISQISQPIIGFADFNFDSRRSIELDYYSDTGLTFIRDEFEFEFEFGFAHYPQATDLFLDHFPTTIAGGGQHDGLISLHTGVAVFDESLSVTQFGLTASNNGGNT